MQIIITKSSKLSGHVEHLLKEKLEKLTTYFERIESATVHFKQDDGQGENEGTLNVRLAIPGPDVIAEASEDTIEKSIAEVSEKLRRQLMKSKDKQNKY